MHLIVDYVAALAKVDGVDDFVVAVFFVAVQVGGLAAVAWGGVSLAAPGDNSWSGERTRIMEEQAVVGSRIFDKPVHGS